MLEEALVALASAGGTAVVTAAGTDAWIGLRHALGRWFGRGNVGREFGRGNVGREQVELERLDQAEGELRTANGPEAERARIRLQAVWQTRIENLLDGLDEAECTRAAEELRSMLAQNVARVGASAGAGGVAVGGNVDIRADRGSVVAWTMGHVIVGNPPLPGTTQG